MAMVWQDLLFAHWPVRFESLQRLIPAGLTLETFDGAAWVGVVPFRMSGVRAIGTPPLPGVSAFPELNVRTYVTAGGKPGVVFFSLDAANRLAVRVARRLFHLPYMDAVMRCDARGEAIEYSSRRVHGGEPPAQFEGSYRPTGPVRRSTPGSLEAFLTERYCMYMVRPDGGILRGEIHHERWPVQPAEAEIRVNTMGEAAGIELSGPPASLLFARRLDVPAWLPVKADE